MQSGLGILRQIRRFRRNVVNRRKVVQAPLIHPAARDIGPYRATLRRLARNCPSSRALHHVPGLRLTSLDIAPSRELRLVSLGVASSPAALHRLRGLASSSATLRHLPGCRTAMPGSPRLRPLRLASGYVALSQELGLVSPDIAPSRGLRAIWRDVASISADLPVSLGFASALRMLRRFVGAADLGLPLSRKLGGSAAADVGDVADGSLRDSFLRARVLEESQRRQVFAVTSRDSNAIIISAAISCSSPVRPCSQRRTARSRGR